MNCSKCAQITFDSTLDSSEIGEKLRANDNFRNTMKPMTYFNDPLKQKITNQSTIIIR